MEFQRKTWVSLLALGMTAVSGTASAVLNVDIGNGPDTVDGSYLNATSLADALAFTTIIFQADNSVSIVDPIDLSGSIFGPVIFNLTLQSALVNINNSIVFGSSNLSVWAPTLNLGATLTDTSATPLGSTRLSGTATQVNVTSTSASIQQGIFFSSVGCPRRLPWLPALITRTWISTGRSRTSSRSTIM